MTDIPMITTKGADDWKSIRNTRWISDDGTVRFSGAKLAMRLVKLGLCDVSGATAMLKGVKRGGCVTTGVSGYTRVW